MYVKYLVANLGRGKNVDEIILGIDGNLFDSLKCYYDVAKKLYDNTQPVKFSTMSTLLTHEQSKYLLDLINEYTSYTDVKGYIKALNDRNYLNRVKDHLKTPLESVQDVLTMVSNLPTYETDTEFEFVEDIASKIIADLRKRKNDRINTGFEKMDTVSRGIGRNELIIVSANPSVGKTQFVLQLFLSLAKKEPVCFVSLEMTKEAAVNRLLPQLLKIKESSFYKAEYTKEEIENMKEYNNFRQSYWNEFYVIEPENTTVDGIMLEVKKLESTIGKPVKILCIDYLSKITGFDNGYSEELREYKNAAYLKTICKKKDKTIFLINSMNKLGEISGLKKLEHEADQMWIMKRNITCESDVESKATKIQVTKNRNSIVGGIADLVYNTDYLRFE